MTGYHYFKRWKTSYSYLSWASRKMHFCTIRGNFIFNEDWQNSVGDTWIPGNTAMESTAQYRPWNLSPSNNTMVVNIVQVPPLVWHKDAARVPHPFSGTKKNPLITLWDVRLKAHITFHLPDNFRIAHSVWPAVAPPSEVCRLAPLTICGWQL